MNASNPSAGGEPGQSSDVSSWLAELERSVRHDEMSRWSDRCRKIRDRYRYESSADSNRRYQMLWSNIEVMKSAVYARPPYAVVKRRFSDPDKVAREASEILERALNTTLDLSDYDTVFRQVRDDFLLFGRGVARIYYEPVFELAQSGEEAVSDAMSTEGQVAEDNDALGEPYLAFENVKIRYVDRHDFRHQPARVWDEVDWVAFRAYMGRNELVERFGPEVGNAVQIGKDPLDNDDRDTGSLSSYAKGRAATKAEVWEIWDRSRNTVLWISSGYPKILEEGPPYLKLEGFFPCPRPAFGTLTQDSLAPVPDYVYYQDQAEEINQLTARIAALSENLKLVGFYPAGPHGEGFPEIERAIAPGFENKMMAIQSWDGFRQGGSGGPPVVWLPIEHVASIIQQCILLRKQLVQDVYEIIGLSDIMRGATDPRETEGAQQLKAQYGGTRIRDRQQELARFCRDIVRLSAQVMCNHFNPDTVLAMSNRKLPSRMEIEMMVAQAQLMGAPLPPEMPMTREDVFSFLGDGVSRKFRVEIENESTVIGDESQEKRDRTELIQAVTQFLAGWGPIVMQEPALAPLAGQLLTFGVRAFRVGRTLEETIEEVSEQLEQRAQAAANSPPQPDPKVQAAQIKAQSEVVKAMGAQKKADAEVQAAQIEAASEAQNAIMAAQRDAFKAATDLQEDERKASIEAMKLAHQSTKQQSVGPWPV